MRTAFVTSSVAVVALVLAACSSAEPVSAPEATASSSDAIIGGVAVDTPALDAVGSLVNITRYPGPPPSEYYSGPFCSATLVGPRTVLTAKHCIERVSLTQDIGFAIGSNGARPKRVIPIVEIQMENTVAGGQIDRGSDVAVVHLASKVEGVEPFAVAPLTESDLGSRFVGIGYGSQDALGTSGTRRAGSLTLRATEGRVYELAFGSFEGFKANLGNVDDLRWRVGDVTTPEGERRARELFDTTTLLAGYEAFVGGAEGDAQICHGDSGGPLARRVDGKNTVYGVASWVNHNAGTSFCNYINVYASFGPATQTFLAEALAWQDPCGESTVEGACDGDTAVRCSKRSEGTRRILKADCAAVGLACGKGVDGQVACVAPVVDRQIDSGSHREEHA